MWRQNFLIARFFESGKCWQQLCHRRVFFHFTNGSSESHFFKWYMVSGFFKNFLFYVHDEPFTAFFIGFIKDKRGGMMALREWWSFFRMPMPSLPWIRVRWGTNWVVSFGVIPIVKNIFSCYVCASSISVMSLAVVFHECRYDQESRYTDIWMRFSPSLFTFPRQSFRPAPVRNPVVKRLFANGLRGCFKFYSTTNLIRNYVNF